MAQQPFDQPQWNDNGDGTVSENVNITGANGILPTDIQNHLTQSITAINAVALTISGGATPSATSSAIPTDGFNEITILALSSASHAGNFQIMWSFDNTNFSNFETPSGDKIQNSVTSTQRWGTIPVRAPYCKIYFLNTDATATPTVTVQVYLKA